MIPVPGQAAQPDPGAAQWEPAAAAPGRLQTAAAEQEQAIQKSTPEQFQMEGTES